MGATKAKKVTDSGLKQRDTNKKADGSVKSARRKKTKKAVPEGVAYISSSFNNTIISITDLEGKVICWSSAGAIGFKGSKKSTPYAAQLVAQAVSKTAAEHGVKALDIRIKGIGPGKDSALRQFQVSGMTIKTIKNITPIPHNGVKKKKKLRMMEGK